MSTGKQGKHVQHLSPGASAIDPSSKYAEYRGSQSSMNRIPPPPMNGGLYTGQPFASKAWANVPINPDAGSMVHDSLKIGNATVPYEAQYQYVSHPRSGNSEPTMPGLIYNEYLNMSFIPCENAPCPDFPYGARQYGASHYQMGH